MLAHSTDNPNKEWDIISTVFFQRYIACLPEITKTSAIV